MLRKVSGFLLAPHDPDPASPAPAPPSETKRKRLHKLATVIFL